MIGRMILTKNMAGLGAGVGGSGGGGGPPGLSGGSGNPSSASILGLKVVGGKRVDNGRLAAIVEKVKRGSVADTIGHLRPGNLSFPSVSSVFFSRPSLPSIIYLDRLTVVVVDW